MKLLLALCLVVLALIAAFKSNGAVDHPLLVDSAARTSDEPERNMLFSPCPIMPRNIPLQQEREA